MGVNLEGRETPEGRPVREELGAFMSDFKVQTQFSELGMDLPPDNRTARESLQAIMDDPGYKQLIPYVVFRHTDPAGRQSVFQYTRGSGQGEHRLHSKRSIGVGGHISSVDADAEGIHPYQEGMRREIEEEVAIDTPYTESCVGLINDDETEVGRVHLGIVHLVEVEQPAVHPRESEIIEAGFRPVEAILNDIEHFETWSQICLRALFVTD